jgi:hypothetical protein
MKIGKDSFHIDKNLNLGSSIQDIKDLLKPELRNINSKSIFNLYDGIIQNHEKRKKKVMIDLKKKKRSKKQLNSTTILEYDFLQEADSKNPQDKKENDELSQASQNFSNISKAFSLAKFHQKNISIYDKNMELRIMKEQRIEEYRNKQKMDEMSVLTFSPEINKTSRRIIQERLDKTLPIHLRYQDLVQEKEHKREIMRINMEEEKMQTLKSSPSNPSLRTRSKSYNALEFESWIVSNNLWQEKKQEKTNFRKREKEEKVDNDENLVFTPKINKNSDMIANIKKLNDSGIKNYDKLYQLHDIKIRRNEQKQIEAIPSFTPKINKFLPNLISTQRHSKNGMDNNLTKTFVFEAKEEKGLTKSSSLSHNKQFMTIQQKSQNILNKNNYSSNLNKKHANNKTPERSNSISMSRKSSKKLNRIHFEDDNNLYQLNVRNGTTSVVSNVTLLRSNSHNKILVNSLVKK